MASRKQQKALTPEEVLERIWNDPTIEDVPLDSSADEEDLLVPEHDDEDLTIEFFNFTLYEVFTYLLLLS